MAENNIHTILNNIIDKRVNRDDYLINLSTEWNGVYSLPENGWNIGGLSETRRGLDLTTSIIANLLRYYDPQYQVILSTDSNMVLYEINPFYLHVNSGPKDQRGNKIGRSDMDILRNLFVRSKVIGREVLYGMTDDSSFQDLLKKVPHYAMELHILREQYTPQLGLEGKAGFIFNMDRQQKYAYFSPQLVKKSLPHSL